MDSSIASFLYVLLLSILPTSAQKLIPRDADNNPQQPVHYFTPNLALLRETYTDTNAQGQNVSRDAIWQLEFDISTASNGLAHCKNKLSFARTLPGELRTLQWMQCDSRAGINEDLFKPLNATAQIVQDVTSLYVLVSPDNGTLAKVDFTDYPAWRQIPAGGNLVWHLRTYNLVVPDPGLQFFPA